MTDENELKPEDDIQQGVQEEVNPEQIESEEAELTLEDYMDLDEQEEPEDEQVEPEAIPDESPFFTLNANDFLAEPAIAFYLASIKDDSHKAEARVSVKAFQDYRNDNPDKMKLLTSSANAISIASVTPVKEQGGFLYRLVREREELEIKAKALSEFIGESEIYARMSTEEQGYMLKQNTYMWQYFDMLVKRIQLLWPSGEKS
jgi:hypothetical protein